MKSRSAKDNTFNDISDLASGTARLARRLLEHAETHPIASANDVRELRSTTKLCLEVVSKSTTDPAFMAHTLKDMDRDQKSLLNDWIHQNARMGKN